MATEEKGGAERAIRWATTLSVIVLAVIAAIISYKHMYLLVRRYGETSWTAALLMPSMVVLQAPWPQGRRRVDLGRSGLRSGGLERVRRRSARRSEDDLAVRVGGFGHALRGDLEAFGPGVLRSRPAWRSMPSMPAGVQIISRSAVSEVIQ
jgi:hypothetical protein